MLSELSDDDLDLICNHLDLVSAVRLASIAKSILWLGDRLCCHADESVRKIQRAFRRHYCWPLGLRAMAKTLNHAAVAFQAQRAKGSILKRLEELTLELEEPWDHDDDPRHVEAASKQMETFVTIIHEFCAETMPPLPAWKHSVTVACVDALIKVMLELGNELGKLNLCWDDQEFVDQKVLFVDTFPPGDEITSLKVYLAQMSVWNGWCYRGEEMMKVILDKSGLLGCALTFFSLHDWDSTELDTSSMYQSTGSFENEVVEAGEDGDILNTRPDKMLARLTDPNHVQCPLKRGLFQAIREKRRAVMQARHLIIMHLSELEICVPRKEYANRLAMVAARNFIAMHNEQ